MSSRVRNNIAINFEAEFTLTEVEMRALDALVGYGDDAFLEVFGKKLGEAYMRDHKEGLKSFFKSVRDIVLPALHNVDEARQVLKDKYGK